MSSLFCPRSWFTDQVPTSISDQVYTHTHTRPNSCAIHYVTEWKLVYIYNDYKIYGIKFYSMDLVNKVRTTKRDPRNASSLGRSKLRSYFSQFADRSSPALVRMRRKDGRLQCRFPFDDILFRSRDIRDQVELL